MKSEIDSFIEMLIQNKITQVIRLTDVLLEPLSSSAKQYFNQWYTATDSERYNNYNVDLYGGETQTYPTFNKFISAKLDRLATSDFTYSIFHTQNEDGYSEVNEEAPFYDYFVNPTVHQVHHEHLDSYINDSIKVITTSAITSDYKEVRNELTELKNKFAKLLPQTAPVIIEIPATPDLPTFSEVAKDYISFNHSENYSNMTLRASAIEAFECELGDLPLNIITTQHILQTYRTLTVLPRENAKAKVVSPYAGLDIAERWEVAKDESLVIEDKYLYGSETVKKYRTTLYDFFEWASDIHNILDRNPLPKALMNTRTLLPKDRKTKRVNFLDADALKIINHCKGNLESPYHWAILLMAYHGIRNSEALALKKKDIIVEEKLGITYLYISGGKTEAAERKIPVHQDLLDLGFYEHSQRSDNLFNVKSGALSAYYFSKLRSLLDLPEETAEGHLLSLYSFRHCVMTKMGRMEAGGAQVKFLVGHKDITSNYTHLALPTDLLALQVIINKIRYD
ncbi:MAG: tyrosine-type recombinase/integrase [Alteromonadales bacterium]|nr:tyrosine-type recombinase/integrase [Alteromonadales bacterium]